LHRFPRGAKPGTFLHGLLEWAAREGFNRVAQNNGLREDTVARRCHLRGWMGWKKPLSDWLGVLLKMPLALPDTTATFAGLQHYQPELEFWFSADHVNTLTLDKLVTQHILPGQARPALLKDRLNGMLKGFIDLVFEHEGRYYVADYKSNWLGADDEAYTSEAMAAAVLEKRYDLQYVLYLLALHRLLQARLREDYDYEQHIGGAVYIFLRGLHGLASGLHVDKPPRELIETLDVLFAGQRELIDVA
jgi:exodeoxyribonuclease V beta subunit